MPIPNIDRNMITLFATGNVTVTPDVGQVVCDATAGIFTVTLYGDKNSGAYHRLVVAISGDDTSGNAVTITDGTFSTSLSATSSSVELEMDSFGAWFIVAEYPTTAAATASSAADSAGLASSIASSEAQSAGATGFSVATSTATSQNTAQSAVISSTSSTATSENTSQSTTISSNKSIAASAVLSGVSAAESIAGSAILSQSSTISVAQSTAAS
jgi:hypothetical protein